MTKGQFKWLTWSPARCNQSHDVTKDKPNTSDFCFEPLLGSFMQDRLRIANTISISGGHGKNGSKSQWLKANSND